MDSPLELLKDEINKTNEQEHDLAKWKLGVTAALGVAAFGITKETDPHHWLLLFVPFVCAYIDLFAYQYQVRIMVIARFLRDHSAGNDTVLRDYESACKGWRKENVFSLGTWAGLGSSLGASLAGPLFYFLVRRHNSQPDTLLVSPCVAVLIWVAGLLLIGGLWVYFRSRVKKVEENEVAHHARA
jgi:hypothetical protein